MEVVEGIATQSILWLKLAVELVGALVIGVGCVKTVWRLVQPRHDRPRTFTGARLQLARYLALGLEFQLAADVLVTAVAPSWEEIGKLAAIATIRTVLNFFLAREMTEERVEAEEERSERLDEARTTPGEAERLADRLASP